MTINREQLITLLEEKTGMSRKSVEEQFDELTSRIMDAAERGKALEIKDFGLFYFDENGDLAFRAADRLDSEINFEYAGLEPVDLDQTKPSAASTPVETPPDSEQPPADEPTAGDTTGADPDDVFGIGKTLSEKEDDEELPKSLSSLFSDEAAADEGEEEDEKDTDAKIKPAGKPINASTAPAGKSAASKTSSAPSKKRKKSRDPMVTIIFVVIAAVAIFIAYVIATEIMNTPEQPDPMAQQDEELRESPAPVTAERDITEEMEPEEPEPVEVIESPAEDKQTQDPIDEVTTTDPYGLYGEIAEAEGTVYTIVVHSLRNLALAEETANEIRDQGFRVAVNQRFINDQTYYRVGIGQFPSIQEAQQEATTLPSPYNEQNFIHRVQ